MSNIWTGRNTQGFSKKILYVSYQLVAARQLFVVSVKECDNFTVCIKKPRHMAGLHTSVQRVRLAVPPCTA